MLITKNFRAEDEGEDIADSDFSIDEDDEHVSDIEQDESRPKKKRLITKAYKVVLKLLVFTCVLYMTSTRNH